MANLLSVIGTSPTPALIWHGNGERIELSHRVIGNWFTKCANALYSEAGLAPGTQLAIDLPPHWRTVAWAGAAQLVGAEVVWESGGVPVPSADAVVSTNPEHPGDLLILTPLASLARSLDVPLPSGAIDGAGDVMSQPDQLIFAPEPLPLDGGPVPDESLPSAVIISDAESATAVPATLRALTLGQLVVLVGDESADLAAIANSEGLTL